MEIRIPELPYIPGPIDAANSYIEVAIPDMSSDTGYTSCRANINDIAMPTIVGLNQIAVGNNVDGSLTSYSTFKRDPATGFIGINNPSPSYFLDILGTSQASIRTKVSNAAATNNMYIESNTGNVMLNLNAFVSGVGTSGGSRINFNHTGSSIASMYTNTATNSFLMESSMDVQLYNNASLEKIYMGFGGIYLQTTGVHRMFISNGGRIGVLNTSPTSDFDINGGNGYSQFRMRKTYTPTSTADANGNNGDVAYDNNYIYIKTNGAWGRALLDFSF